MPAGAVPSPVPGQDCAVAARKKSAASPSTHILKAPPATKAKPKVISPSSAPPADGSGSFLWPATGCPSASFSPPEKLKGKTIIMTSSLPPWPPHPLSPNVWTPPDASLRCAPPATTAGSFLPSPRGASCSPGTPPVLLIPSFPPESCSPCNPVSARPTSWSKPTVVGAPCGPGSGGLIPGVSPDG